MSKRIAAILFCVSLPIAFAIGASKETPQVPLSRETMACIECHRIYTPGIVEDWLSSRHSKMTPGAALGRPEIERRISNSNVPEILKGTAVGCYECHSQNPSAHKDNFEHMGFRINVVVSPADCRTCHLAEADQFSGSKKAHAVDNLEKNAAYSAMVSSIIGVKGFREGKQHHLSPTEETKGESCYACHGTVVGVKGLQKVSTEMGEVEVPELTNWPNQGVGRVNPDGTLGACSACHARHSFSIEVARKPYTCAQCHLQPDVPAWDVYEESKHGNIFLARQREFNWDSVPWKPGRDFKTPTCASCHTSLLATADGEQITARSHDFGSRLWVRIFGLIYSHPQTKDGRTYLIRNRDGLAMPTSFSGEPAAAYLIDPAEQSARQGEMRRVCTSCHSTSWTNQRFARIGTTLAETDRMVAASTELIQKAWHKGIVDKSNPFDESLEQKWIKQWLFYANSVRYASAMNGPDYASFKNGWWEMTTNLQEMKEAVEEAGRKSSGQPRARRH